VPPTIVKLVTCPRLPACSLNQKKKPIVINTGLLAYTFNKFGDNNLTKNDGDTLVDISNST